MTLGSGVAESGGLRGELPEPTAPSLSFPSSQSPALALGFPSEETPSPRISHDGSIRRPRPSRRPMSCQEPAPYGTDPEAFRLEIPRFRDFDIPGDSGFRGFGSHYAQKPMPDGSRFGCAEWLPSRRALGHAPKCVRPASHAREARGSQRDRDDGFLRSSFSRTRCLGAKACSDGNNRARNSHPRKRRFVVSGRRNRAVQIADNCAATP